MLLIYTYILNYEMKNRRMGFSAFCLLWLLCGCTGSLMRTDEPDVPMGSGDAVISITVTQQHPAEVSATRAFSDEQIKDMHVLVYNSNGDLTGHGYATGNRLTLRAASGSGCTLYAIANTGDELYFNGQKASTLTKLRALLTANIASVEGIKANDCLLMCGSLPDVTLNGGATIQSVTGLTVERLAAKITLNVTTAPGIALTGYRVRNLPASAYLAARPNADENSETDVATGDDGASAWFDENPVTAPAVSNLSFYMYENRRGDRVSVNGGKGTLTNQQQKALYAPAHATYVELYAQGPGYTATYKIYLGADNCRNYNVKRNGNYTYNVNIQNALWADTRVNRIAAPANCYVVQPQSEVVFPVSRANEDGTTRIANLNAGWTAELLWTDHSGGVKANGSSSIKSVAAQLSNGTIRVETGSAEGNALVVAKVGGTVVWSWHIWVTAYNPDADNVTYGNGTKTTVFMNRNLGAKSNTVANASSYGMLYQWGRKDPFPPASTLTTTSTSVPIYNAAGTQLPEDVTGVKKTAVAVSNNLANSIANPLTFYTRSSARYDWYSNSSSVKNDYLWNSTEGAKTVYDPCPYGWRVPVSGGGSASPWYSSSSGNYTNATFNYGWNWTKAAYPLGWYPAQGYRRNSNGSFRYTGVRGYYWSATPYNYYAYSLYFRSSSVSPSYTSSQYRAYGYAVRCVKE